MSDDLLPGFAEHWIETEAGRIFARSAGSGPPVVMLHGFPQTHVCWHRIAPALAETHHVVCLDLRGYGGSSAPPGDPQHETYPKRAMGRDVVAVMDQLGHRRFALVGHDRGARVGYRLALDQPDRLDRLILLDILPTFYVWRQVRAGVVPAAHWDFLSRPYPQPEQEIARDPVPFFDGLLVKWTGDGTLGCFDPRAFAAYHAPCGEADRIHAFCEDYRAGATVDLYRDEEAIKLGRTISCPVLAVWGGKFYLTGRPGAETTLEVWQRTFAPQATGAPLDAGHFLAEEDPAGVLAALRRFLNSR